MVGPPGSGKTVLARRLSEILSSMVLPEAIETTKLYSVVGMMPKNQPLEDKSVTIARAASTLTYPSSFMLVAAMNSCPCGFLNDPKHACRCTATKPQ